MASLRSSDWPLCVIVDWPLCVIVLMRAKHLVKTLHILGDKVFFAHGLFCTHYILYHITSTRGVAYCIPV